MILNISLQTRTLQNALTLLRWKCWDHEKRAKQENSPFLYQTQITSYNKNWRCGCTEYEQTQYRSLGECQHFHFDGALFIIVLVWGEKEKSSTILTKLHIISLVPEIKMTCSQLQSCANASICPGSLAEAWAPCNHKGPLLASDHQLTTITQAWRAEMLWVQQRNKNKEFAFSRLGPQPAWPARGCYAAVQLKLIQAASLVSHFSQIFLALLPSPPQLSPTPASTSSYPPHSGGWLPTSPHRAVSLLRDSPSVFIDLPAAAAVRWQQQNWGAAVHKLLLRQRRSARSGATYKRRHKKICLQKFILFVW